MTVSHGVTLQDHASHTRRASATVSGSSPQTGYTSNASIETTLPTSPPSQKFEIDMSQGNCRHHIVRSDKRAGCGGSYPVQSQARVGVGDIAQRNDSSPMPQTLSSGIRPGNWTGTGSEMGYTLPTPAARPEIDHQNKRPTLLSNKWPLPITAPTDVSQATPIPFTTPSAKSTASESTTVGDAAAKFSSPNDSNDYGSPASYTLDKTAPLSPTASPDSVSGHGSFTTTTTVYPYLSSLSSSIESSCSSWRTIDGYAYVSCWSEGVATLSSPSWDLTVVTNYPLTVTTASNCSPSSGTACDVSPRATIQLPPAQIKCRISHSILAPSTPTICNRKQPFIADPNPPDLFVLWLQIPFQVPFQSSLHLSPQMLGHISPNSCVPIP